MNQEIERYRQNFYVRIGTMKDSKTKTEENDVIGVSSIFRLTRTSSRTSDSRVDGGSLSVLSWCSQRVPHPVVSAPKTIKSMKKKRGSDRQCK